MLSLNGYTIIKESAGYLVKTEIWNGRKFKLNIKFNYIFPDDKMLLTTENRIIVNPNTFKLFKQATKETIDKVFNKVKTTL